MRWKSDLKAAECCAASEDESGSQRSSDEVGHADSSVVEVGASRAWDQSIEGGPGLANKHRGAIFTILQKQRKKEKKKERQKMTPSSIWRN